jgi:hypothetical protein
MSKLSIKCLEFKPYRKNTLQGLATIRIEQMRLTVHEVAIHAKDNKAWAHLPSRPWLKDGYVVTGEDGKIKYTPLFEFDGGAVRAAFSDAAVRAVLELDPHALDPGRTA